MLSGLSTRSRELPAGPWCTQPPRPPACSHVYTNPTLPGSSHRESSRQASISPQKGGETPTEARMLREAGRDLRAQTQRKAARIRAEAQAPITFLHCGQAHVGGHGHQTSAGALPSWSLGNSTPDQGWRYCAPSRPGAQLPWRARERGAQPLWTEPGSQAGRHRDAPLLPGGGGLGIPGRVHGVGRSKDPPLPSPQEIRRTDRHQQSCAERRGV